MTCTELRSACGNVRCIYVYFYSHCGDFFSILRVFSCISGDAKQKSPVLQAIFAL